MPETVKMTRQTVCLTEKNWKNAPQPLSSDLPIMTSWCSSPCSQGLKKIPPEKLSRISELVEPWFIFSLIWSVGATGDSLGRVAFNQWLRTKMAVEKVRG